MKFASFPRSFTNVRVALAASVGITFLAACGLPKQETSTKHISERPEVTAALTPPSLRPVRLTAVPSAPVPRAAQEVLSVVVNDVPVKTLLFALARDNRLNVDIHPSVGGRVTLNATDQTLPQLLERIAAQSDIRYEINGNLLRVQPDAPYLSHYAVDYVNLARQSTSSVSVNSSLTSSSSGGSVGAGGSSGSSISTTTDHRFWDTLISNICQIVLTSNQNRNQRDEQVDRQRTQDREDRLRVAMELVKALQPNKDGKDPSPASGTNDLMRQVMGSAGGADAGGGAGAAAMSPTAAAPKAGSGTGMQAATGAAQTNASGGGGITPCGAAAGGTSGASAGNPLMVNKESGVIGINTTSKGHEQVRAFIDRVMAGVRRQVLIEATVVEVQLSSGSQSGVNWSQLVSKGAANGLSIGIGPVATGSVSSAISTGNTAATISYTGTNSLGTIASAISLLESFGQTKVLSSPKLSVINNQTAIIKVVDDFVYVTIEYIPASISNTGTVTSQAAYNSRVNTVPVGFVMTVTPQISDAGDVTLNVRPSITRVINTIVDPNPTLLNSPKPIVNLIPVVQTREMESVLRVQSGEIVVLGGLMQESMLGSEQGIPGVNRVPVVSTALGQRSETRAKTELIVFLRPVVIRDASINGDYKEYKSQLPTSTFFNGTAAEAWGTKK